MLNGLLVPGIAFLLTIGFGLWLSYSGKPYNGILFNLHKLVALGTAILAGVRFYDVLKSMSIQALSMALIVIVGLCMVVLFTTGGLMSAGKLNYKIELTMHRIVIVLAIALIPITISFLFGRII